VPNSDLAYHPLIAQRYPMLATAILAGAIALCGRISACQGAAL
jgi:xanthine dehydrogenase YagS FAD-binding subunit